MSCGICGAPVHSGCFQVQVEQTDFNLVYPADCDLSFCSIFCCRCFSDTNINNAAVKKKREDLERQLFKLFGGEANDDDSSDE